MELVVAKVLNTKGIRDLLHAHTVLDARTHPRKDSVRDSCAVGEERRKLCSEGRWKGSENATIPATPCHSGLSSLRVLAYGATVAVPNDPERHIHAHTPPRSRDDAVPIQSGAATGTVKVFEEALGIPDKELGVEQINGGDGVRWRRKNVERHWDQKVDMSA